MSSEKTEKTKTISINPDLFKVSNKSKKRKQLDDGTGTGLPKEIKYRPMSSSKAKTAKGKILKYIREQQEKNYKRIFDEAVSKNRSINEKDLEEEQIAPSDFQTSLTYLKHVSDMKEQEKKEAATISQYNHTIKNKSIPDAEYFKSLTAQPMQHSPPSPHPQQRLELANNIVHEMRPQVGATPVILAPRPVPLEQPKFGCLKNGNLPTYRSMMQKTLRNPSSLVSPPVSIPVSNKMVQPLSYNVVNPASSGVPMQQVVPGVTTIPRPPQTGQTLVSAIPPRPPVNTSSNQVIPSFLNNMQDNPTLKSGLYASMFGKTSEERVKRLSEAMKVKQFMSAKSSVPSNLKYMKQKKTIKRTHFVGKSKAHPKVAVLVSNKTIRKDITTKSIKIKQTPMHEVRTYLIKHGFIRVGSSAPNDVLRKMYESVLMIGGEINNHNPENLLHNYMNSAI